MLPILPITVIVYVLALIFTGCMALEEEKCPLLSDENAEMYRSWLFFWNKKHFADKLGKKADAKLSEPQSQCLASIRPGYLIPWKKAISCIQTRLHFSPSRFETLKNEFSSLMDGLKDGKLAEPFENLRAFLQGIPTEDYQENCEALENYLNPCVLRVVTLFLQHAKKNECCAAFRKEFRQLTGAKLNFEFFESFLYAVQDIGCAKRDENGTVVACGHQLTQTLFNSSLQAVVPNALVAVQIPNDQACKAFNAEPFRPTTGSKPYQFETNVGCCANYLDNAFTFFSRMPIVRQKLSENMFLPGRCRAVSSGLCTHLPNHFSGSCSFQSSCTAKSDSLNQEGIFIPTPPLTAPASPAPSVQKEKKEEEEEDQDESEEHKHESEEHEHESPRPDAPENSAVSNSMYTLVMTFFLVWLV